MPQLTNKQHLELAKRASEALHKQEQREAERKAAQIAAKPLGESQLGGNDGNK